VGLLEDFERSHTRRFLEIERFDLPKQTLRTPDGKDWTIQQIVPGHSRRISDRWAWITLHCWIRWDAVDVTVVDLPAPLLFHRPTADAWAFIEREYGPGEREPQLPFFGRADFEGVGRSRADGSSYSLFVEFGNVPPAKFLLNLGYAIADYMIVPYGSPFAFVFFPTQTLLSRPRNQKK